MHPVFLHLLQQDPDRHRRRRVKHRAQHLAQRKPPRPHQSRAARPDPSAGPTPADDPACPCRPAGAKTLACGTPRPDRPCRYPAALRRFRPWGWPHHPPADAADWPCRAAVARLAGPPAREAAVLRVLYHRHLGKRHRRCDQKTHVARVRCVGATYVLRALRRRRTVTATAHLSFSKNPVPQIGTSYAAPKKHARLIWVRNPKAGKYAHLGCFHQFCIRLIDVIDTPTDARPHARSDGSHARPTTMPCSCASRAQVSQAMAMSPRLSGSSASPGSADRASRRPVRRRDLRMAS